MKIKDQIDLLLNSNEEIFQHTTPLYKKSINEQKLDQRVLVNVKNYLENARSVLDYIACEIFRKYCSSPKSVKTYFPILKKTCSDDQIINKIIGLFPNLKENHEQLFQLLVNGQPKSDVNNWWLEEFSGLCNQNKHSGLSLQTRKDDIVNKLEFYNKRNFIWSDGLVTFKAPDTITILPGGIYRVNEILSPDKETDHFWSIGWIVQKLSNHQMRSGPDLTSFDKSQYTCESYLVGNFYFPNIKVNAYFTLEKIHFKILELKKKFSDYI